VSLRRSEGGPWLPMTTLPSTLLQLEVDVEES
jgi:hypothetical protein